MVLDGRNVNTLFAEDLLCPFDLRQIVVGNAHLLYLAAFDQEISLGVQRSTSAGL